MKKLTKKNSAKKQSKKARKLSSAPKKSLAQGKKKTSPLSQVKPTSSIQASVPVVTAQEVQGKIRNVAEKTSTASTPSATSSPNVAVFFCFLAIFACMLIFESRRFTTYLEGESGEYPALRPVSEAIDTVAEQSGIGALMQWVGQWTTNLSQEYIIVADKSLQEQWQDLQNFYGSLLGFPVAEQQKSDPPFQKIPSENVIKSQTMAAVPTETSSEKSDVKSMQPSEKSSDTVAEKKQEESLEAKQSSVHYAYYDASRMMAAPSSQGIEEYVANIPDYGKKVKILLIGDSMMMEGLGPTLQKALRKRSDVEVVREGRYSSGLSKPDFFNWPENLKKLLEKHAPDMLIISLGANDTQDIMVGKKRFRIDTDGWERVYAIRVLNFLELATENNRKVLWVSLPIMGPMPYGNRTKLINAITADMSAFYPAVAYENIEHLLTKNGKYTSFIKDKDNKTIRLRSKDNIHVSTAGGHILTRHVLPYAEERLARIRMEQVQENPFIPVPGKANTIQFSSTARQKMAEYVVYLPSFVEKKNEQALPASLQSIQNESASSSSVQSLIQQSLQKTGSVQSAEKKAEERFPVLYVLHGATGHAKDWNAHMGQELQRVANEKRVIIVAPETEEHGWYVNSPNVWHNQLETFVAQELIPHVDMLFPTNGKRAVAGLSMGGHGAVTLGFKYPKLFQSVASVSGVLDIRLHKDSWKIAELLGAYEKNTALWNKNSAVNLMEKSISGKRPQQILISTGLQDALVLEDNQKAASVLEKKKLNFEYQELAGEHSWAFWAQEIPRQLRKQADFLHKK